MDDLHLLSDDQLVDLAHKASGRKPLQDSLDDLPDEELVRLATNKKLASDGKPHGFLETLDSYTGAPTRAALGSIIDGKRSDEGDTFGLGEGVKSFAGQWGKSPRLAPSQSQLANKIGFSDKSFQNPIARKMVGGGIMGLIPGGPLMQAGVDAFAPEVRKSAENASPADIAGVPIGMGADWTNAIPLGMAGKAFGKAKGLLTGAKQTEEGILGAKNIPRPPIPADSVRNTIQEAMPPQSFEAVSQAVKDAKNQGWSTDLPTFKEVQKAQSVLKGESDLLPIRNDQLEAYRSKNNYATIKTFKELDSPEAKSLLDYEAIQKQQAVAKLQKEIQNIAPNGVAPHPTAAGEDLIDKFSRKYDEMKNLTGPLFDKIDSTPIPPEANGTFLSGKLGKALGLQKYIVAPKDVSGVAGVERLLPYNRAMGISPKVYGIINETMDTLNNNQLTVKELRALRESIRGEINPLMSKTDQAQLGRIRTSLLDHIQDVSEAAHPGVPVRPTFKYYAKNEQNLEQMGKTMGGSLDDYAKSTQAVKPELAVAKIFNNTNSVKLAKETLGKDFGDVLANYLQQLASAKTDKGVFSSQQFSQALKRNDAVLSEAFKENPAQYEKIKALADYMRMVPDAPTPNPSQSAPTMTRLMRMSGLLSHPTQIPGKLLGAIENKMGMNASKNEMGGLLKSPLESFKAQGIETNPEILNQKYLPTDPVTYLTELNKNKMSQFLSPKTPEDLQNHKIFLSTDKTVGYAISPEGDFQGLFNNGKKGAGEEAVIHGIAQGAKTGDSFAGFLPQYYSDFGFKLTRGDKWNDMYAPKGWDYGKFGRPDIVYMEFPKTLDRSPEASATRLGIARAERAARLAGTPGPAPSLPISGKYSGADFSAWGRLDKSASGASSGPTGLLGKSIRPAYQGLLQTQRSRDD